MYDELIKKIKRIKPNTLSDTELQAFVEEAAAKLSDEGYSLSGDTCPDDVLLYFVLSQIALFSGDLAEYSNYSALYNNAARAFGRRAFERSASDSRTAQYQNRW